tara:strand:+ start:1659 stop:2894 length:1236 start_codon:yes stop_codon:yes gene_type:complete
MTAISLFRQEVVEARKDRLPGEINVALPVSWQAIGFLLAIILLTAILFFSFASYARVQTVPGVIVPDSGVAAVVPSRTGIILTMPVRSGERVTKGQVLATVRTGEDLPSGAGVAETVLAALQRQSDDLNTQAGAQGTSAKEQISQIIAKKIDLRSEIAALQQQISLQENLLASGKDDLARIEPVAKRGFIPANEVRQRQDVITQRQQQLAQLQQSLASARAQLTSADSEIAQIQAQSAVQAASIQSSLSQLDQQIANTRAARSYALRAPVSGQVSSITGHVGAIANPQAPLMSVLPDNARLRAELYVPTTAIGFVHPGQVVRLAIDAFPYSQFGTVKGRIDTVSTTTTTRSTPSGPTTFYLVTVTLSRTSIQAYGADQKLLSDMSLAARIITNRQSLLEWLFNPLIAIGRR